MINNNGYLPNFEFNKNWENPLDFPTLETNEEQVRADMQDLHEQVKAFINNRLIPAIRNGAFGSWELYDESKQYKTGDKVLYEGFIYVCKIPCQGVLPTDDTYWVKVNMGSGPGGGDTSWIYDEINKVYSELKQDADEISAEVTDLDDSLRAEIKLTAGQLTSRIESGESATYSAITQTSDLLHSEMANVQQEVRSVIEQSADTIYSEVMNDVRGDLSRVEQEAAGIKATVSNVQGDVSSLKQTATTLSAGLADAEGDIYQLELTAEGLTSRVDSAEGDISRVEQTAEDISASVIDLDKNLRAEIDLTAEKLRAEMGELEIDTSGLVSKSEFEMTKNSISASVQAVETSVTEFQNTVTGELETLSKEITEATAEFNVTADEIRSEVTRVETSIAEGDEAVTQSLQSSLTQTAQDITSRVEASDARISVLQQTADGLTSAVADADGKASLAQQKVDSIKLSVGAPRVDAGGQTYAAIELTVDGKTQVGNIYMTGNVDVSGQLSADALYAAKGDIADLTVDKFSTSRRIVKYLARDTTDDNYIVALDEKLAFVSGEYAGGEVQATNPSGLPLWWDTPESEWTGFTADGYPMSGAGRVNTTTENLGSGQKVWVFTYKELIKASFAFANWGDIYTPVLTMGAGDQTGYNKGWLVKEAEAMKLLYRTGNAKDLGIVMNNTGYMDLTGLRKPTNIAFTQTGFTVTVDGGLSESFSYVHDANGNITSIVDSTGHVTTVSGVSG